MTYRSLWVNPAVPGKKMSVDIQSSMFITLGPAFHQKAGLTELYWGES